ncbi:MAG: hypothetical protein KKD39_04280 [Candidatus Altiarchaeota archaeon]|nr:hypothetical protein [Candidatus Altiarchaeota archaeon]
MDVSKVHFLVHPGYGLSGHKYGTVSLSEFGCLQESRLLRLYGEKIGSIEDDGSQVLVILAPTRGGKLRDDVKVDSPWIGFIKEAKDRLGSRCVVFSSPLFLPVAEDNMVVEDGERGVFADKLRKTLSVRGLNVGDETESEVWGQSTNYCVKLAYDWVESYMGFKGKPVIPGKSTDLGLLDASILESELRSLGRAGYKTVNRR